MKQKLSLFIERAKNIFLKDSDTKKRTIIGGVVLALIIVAIAVPTFIVPRDSFTLAERVSMPVMDLVPDAISQNAPIVVTLPEGVVTEDIAKAISFSPAVRGKWTTSEKEGQYIFKPAKTLKIDRYYDIRFRQGGVEGHKMFLVVDDPRIDAIFPGEGTEIDVDDKLTIMFTRPMVALSTRDTLDDADIPITITPEIDGTFTWLGTRTLQFDPTDRWIRSTQYNVVVNEGFVTTEGLKVEVPKKAHSFIIKPLRIIDQNFTGATGAYRIVFNQEIDLTKTQKNIELFKKLNEENEEKKVPIIAEYGTSSVYDKTTRAYKEVRDTSVLFIYPAKDILGRAKSWDFEANYRLNISDVLPAEGHISLPEPIRASFGLGTVVEYIDAQSDRSTHTGDRRYTDMFDPEGTVRITFSEPVSRVGTIIRAPGLTTITYDQVCDPEKYYYYIEGCDMVDNKKVLVLDFNPQFFSNYQPVPITIARVTHENGFVLNRRTIDKTFTVFPQLRVEKIVLEENNPLVFAYVCTTTPLKQVDKEEFFESVLSSNESIFFRNWGWSYRPEDPCKDGQFATRIHWGLQPLTNYAINLNVTDDFGQKAIGSWSGTTKDISNVHNRLRSMQDFYTTTVPSRTKLTYVSENYKEVGVAICKLKAETMVELLGDNPRGVEPRHCEEIKHEVIDMPDVFWANMFLQVDISKHFAEPRGHYAILLGSPVNNTEFKTTRDQIGFLTVSDLVATEKKINWSDQDSAPDFTEEVLALSQVPGNLYWVVNANTLKPVNGAQITTYLKSPGVKQIKKGNMGTTGPKGVVVMKPEQNAHAAIVTLGTDSTIITSNDILQWSGRSQTDERGYIYTDRPLYRPGHEVFFKGIVRQEFDAVYSLVPDLTEIDVTIYDSRGGSVAEEKIAVNEFGTFNGSITLPNNAALGSYRIQTPFGAGRFEVEEFVGAPFNATISSDRDEYLSGQTANITFDAEYFFGSPVPNVDVTYSITSQDYSFDKFEGAGQGFRFGAYDYSCYECGFDNQDHHVRKETFIEKGKTVVTETLDLAEFFEDDEDYTSKIFVVHASMKDTNGRSVSAQHSFIVHAANVYTGIKTDSSFVSQNEPVTISALTTNIQGVPIARAGVQVVIEKEEWQQFQRQAVDGRFYEKWERVLTEVARNTINTDATGQGSTQIALDRAGQYRVRVIARDVLGRESIAQTHLYVHGNDAALFRTGEGRNLDVEVADDSVEIGDVADIIVKSPFSSGKALIATERGRIFSYDIIDITGNIIKYPVLITKEHAPNVSVSVLALSRDPEVRSGRVFLDVNKEMYNLDVVLKTNKEAYLPGEEVTAEVVVTDYEGRPVQAEVSLAAVDMSILALKGNPKKNPLEFFFRRLPFLITTSNTAAHMLEQMDIPENTGKKSGDGGLPGDLARKKRGEFRETAFWEANVNTDINGYAVVKFRLPDNLTTWQLEGVAVTKDTKVGVGYHDFLEKKNVLIQPLLPRFVLPEDKVSLGAIITNQTTTPQTLTVKIESETLDLSEAQEEQTIVVGKEDQRTVYFDVAIPDSDKKETHTITLSAGNRAYEDVVELSFPTSLRRVNEATALSGITQAEAENEYVFVPSVVSEGEGSLSVRAHSTLAVYVSDALNQLLEFPYGCSEQVMSKIGALAIVHRSLGIENLETEGIGETVVFQDKEYSVEEAIAEGLKRAYENQNPDGGIGYFKDSDSNLYLTMHVMDAMHHVKQAGFTVDEEAVGRMGEYVAKQLSELFSSRPSGWGKDTLINGVKTLSRWNPKPPSYKSLVRDIERFSTKQYLYEQASTMTLNNLALLGAEETLSRKTLSRALDALQNRIVIDARGAYVGPGGIGRIYEGYETNIKNTALYIQNIVAHRIKTPVRDELLRWIFANRTKDGSWQTTNNNLAVLDALTDYMKWTKENRSRYNAMLLVDGQQEKQWSVNKNTFTDTVEWERALDDLPKDTNIQIGFVKQNKNRFDNNLYYDILLEYALPVEEVEPRDNGIYIERNLALVDNPDTAITEASVGDIVRGEITIITAQDRRTFALEDKIPAGFELINFSFATESRELVEVQSEEDRSYGGTRTLHPDHTELRDDRIFTFKEFLPAGTYRYEYYLRAQTPGEFQHLPATAYDFYFPENFGRTAGGNFTINKN